MKLNKIYGIFATAMLFTACASPALMDMPDITDENVLNITSVSQNGFASADGTRAAYTDTYATSFEEGDRLGLVLVGTDGTQIANVPFTYTANGTWNNDRNQLYLSNVTKIVAYFPYNETLPISACDIESVKSNITVPLDQSNQSAFTATDLLVCEMPNTGADIDISFSHAFSMLRFSSSAKVIAGDREYEYSVALEGLKVTIGNDIYTPCYLNGGYVMIVKDATTLQPELFKYTYRRSGEDRATKTTTSALTTSAATVFSFPCPPTGAATATVSAGAYYCSAEDNGMVVIIPAGAAEIPAGLICQGIVFHVMDNPAFSVFAADNALTAADYPGFDNKHGFIVSLQQSNILLSGYNAGDVANNEFLKNVFVNYEESGNTEVSLGYKLTQMLANSYGTGNAGVTFTGLEGFALPLTYCTNWYIPSFNELKYMIRGDEDPSTPSLDGQEMLNRQLTVVSGTLIEGNQPSVSFKQPDGFCIMQNGEEMGWHGVPDGEKCRPICAF